MYTYFYFFFNFWDLQRPSFLLCDVFDVRKSCEEEETSAPGTHKFKP